MRILHTESSTGWGGQEIRILKESIGLRERGHEIFFGVAATGGLVPKAREEGFRVHELAFARHRPLCSIFKLVKIIQNEAIDLVVTHSSLDAWLGGIAARICRRPIVRLRHLSTPSRGGINSFLLYKALADYVVTTSSCAAEAIVKQAKLSKEKCCCVPTGVEPQELLFDPLEAKKFREKHGISPDECLVGTVCFVRSWKGIKDLLKAAALLKHETKIKWIVIGGGYVEEYKPFAKELGVADRVIFTGHLNSPFAAMGALDIFTLLSTAHEGISQASLQAAFLGKPLITTPVGGLPEVCVDEKTGLIVPAFSPERVKDAVLKLASSPDLRKSFGEAAKELVAQKFTLSHTLEEMEKIYSCL